jgi:hypothetical protein
VGVRDGGHCVVVDVALLACRVNMRQKYLVEAQAKRSKTGAKLLVLLLHGHVKSMSGRAGRRVRALLVVQPACGTTGHHVHVVQVMLSLP